MNAVGYGKFGRNSARDAFTLLKSVPLIMYSPYRGEQTSVNQIQVMWNSLLPPNDGASPILSYNLVWDAGMGDCTIDLIGSLVPYLQL